MKKNISALVDGELDVGETITTVRALRGCGELRAEWANYHRIGTALRGEPDVRIDVVASVMSALETEPTILAPRPRTGLDHSTEAPGRGSKAHPMLAIAASAAGVALVVWVVLTLDGGAGDESSAKLAASAPPVVAIAKSTLPVAPRLQEYLVAHQVYSPGGAIVGGARNIHTVSATGEAR